MPARGMRSSGFVKVIGVTPLVVVVTLLQSPLGLGHFTPIQSVGVTGRMQWLDQISSRIWI